MDQKLRKLLRPSRGIYFFILGGFCAAALLTEQYILAGVEAAVTLLVLTGYTLSRNYRNRKIQQFLQSSPETRAAARTAYSPSYSFLPCIIANPTERCNCYLVLRA